MPTWIAILVSACIAATVTVVIFVFRWAWKRARWEGGVDSDRTHFKESLADLKVSVDRILRRLMRLTGGEGDTVAGHSRLSLTPLGKTVSEEIRAKAWAAELRPALADETKEMVPYEVQEFCMNFVRGSKLSPTKERRGLVLEVAFDHGLHEADVLEVLAIELRDTLLALRETVDA